MILIILSNARDALTENRSEDRRIGITRLSGKDNSGGRITEIRKEIRNKNNGGETDPSFGDRIYKPCFTIRHKNSGNEIGLYMSKMNVEENTGGKIFHKNESGSVAFFIQV